MEKNLSHYLHKHTRFVTFIVFMVFLLLACGEYYLYRKQMYLNEMVSEGFMQLKEVTRPEPTPRVEFMMINGKMQMRKDNRVALMEKDVMTPSGEIVMTNGTVIQTDGTKIILQEGGILGFE